MISIRCRSARRSALSSSFLLFASSLLGAGLLGVFSSAGCGSPPSRAGLFDHRADGAASSGSAGVNAGGQGGGGGDTFLPNQVVGDAGPGGAGAGGVSGSAGTSGAGGANEPAPVGDAGPDAAGDAATGDAGDDNPLGCAPAERADCEALVSAIVHRYSFTGSGTAVVDSAGNADGSVQNGTLSGTGEVALDGNDQFVDLPNGIVSQLQSATFEAWVDWAGESQWQRIFDFGSSDGSEGTRGSGTTYLFVTARASSDSVRVSFRSPETGAEANDEIRVEAAGQLPADGEHHVAVVVDEQAQTLSLFIDGALAGSNAFTNHLSELSDVNNWLGMSQFDDDPLFEGSILEFRMYGAALSPEQIALSFELGPEAAVTQ